MKVIKRAFGYAFRVKKLFIATIIIVAISMVMDILPTRITQHVLDDYVSGITYPWYEIDQKVEDSVELNGHYYIQDRFYKDNATIIDDACVIELNMKLYLIQGEASVVDGAREIVGDQLKITTETEDVLYEVQVLDLDDAKSLYTPYVQPIIFVLIGLACIYFAHAIINYFVNFNYAKLAISLATMLRYDMFDKMQRLSIDYFQSEPDGRIVSKITNDTDSIRELYGTVISILMEGAFKFVLIFGSMMALNFKFAMIVACVLPFIFLWIFIYRKITNRYSTKIRALNSQINAVLNENIKGMRVIQAFNQEQFIFDEFEKMNHTYYDYRVKQMKLNVNVGGPVFGLFRRVTQIMVILFFGIQAVKTGQFATYGVMYAFTNYLSLLLDPIDLIIQSVEILEDASVSGKRVFDFLDLEEEGDVDFEGQCDDFEGSVEFDHVSFKYGPDLPYVLKDVSFKVEPKQTVAFVGHTGSGKSTTMSLLMRFYNYLEGSIKVDGIELNSMSKQAFRRHVGMVLQDPVLFKGTIKSNISLNDNTVTDEMVTEALKNIGADVIMEKYKDGIHTPIANLGENLSTGERQLLSFARAMLYDPSILILDEATANIDTQTEKMIQHALSVASKDRTTFIVAHRLSTIKHADLIVVLDGGKIIEMGQHDSLIELGGKYYQMYLSQSNTTA